MVWGLGGILGCERMEDVGLVCGVCGIVRENHGIAMHNLDHLEIWLVFLESKRRRCLLCYHPTAIESDCWKG